MTTPPEEPVPERGKGGRAEWALLAALLLYSVAIFYGIGPPVNMLSPAWYEPRAFLFDLPLTDRLLESLVPALIFFLTPSLVLTALVFRAGRSAVARTASLACVAVVPLLLFYGLVVPQVWSFFHWRGSAVLWLVGICLGLSLGAPLLARSWLRLRWPARIAVYLPFFLAAIAFILNATGTDERLPYAISPWPVVPVFGMEVGALLVCVSLVGVALGLFGMAIHRSGAKAGLALAVVAGLGAPALLLWLGGALGMLPFRVGARTVSAVVIACVVVIAAAVLPLRTGAAVLRGRARATAVGAALVALPLLSGQAIARYDYHVTRDGRARAIIDALEAYLEKEELYPDDLQTLVDGAYLDEVPEPSIGFGFLYDGEFRYQSFGTSFILEFPAPRWVECAYTPPYDDDYEDEEEEVAEMVQDEESLDEGPLGEAWSCPSRPPELW